MKKDKQTHYVTHIVRDELPKEGLSMLYFYTKRGNKYYWGTDNNSFDEEYIKNLENKKQVIKLLEPIEIKPESKKGLWIDYEGNIYTADINEPYSDELSPLENISLIQ